MNHSNILFLLVVSTALLPTGIFCQEKKPNLMLTKIKFDIERANIIGLGEESHGYETFNQVKSEIAILLFQEFAFESIIFESSFNAGIISYLNKEPLQLRTTSSLYPYWNTSSVQKALQIFEHEELKSEKPHILGCDIQEDCRYVQLSNFLIRNNYIQENGHLLKQCDSILEYFIGENFSKRLMSEAELNFLLNSYTTIASELEKYDKNTELLLQCIKNRKWLCKYLSIKDVKQRMGFRDSLMAENVLWIKKKILLEKGALLWAANTHIAKQKNINKPPKWLGERLSIRNEIKFLAISVEKSSLVFGKDRLDENRSIFYPKQELFDVVIYCKRVVKIKPQDWITKCKN